MANNEKFCIVFLCLLMATCSYSQQDQQFFRKDYTFLNDTQNFYKFHTLRKNFDDAIRVCELEGAQLFYPVDEDEVNVVSRFWRGTQKPLGNVLIGVYSIIEGGDFITIDGQSISDVYNGWAPGEPNNAPPGEQCVIMLQDGLLNDVPCSDSRPFICRKSLSSLTNWNYACNIPDSGYKYETTLDKCYKFHLEPKTWRDAYDTCSAEQSYLAIVNSEEENRVLVRITAEAPKENIQGNYLRGAVHLGFLKTPSRGWVTIKGRRLEDSGFSRWGGGQPDNAGGNEVCGSMFYSGGLNDINCDVKMFFICEHDIDGPQT